MRKNSADVDGAGRADVGHGAEVGDLVDGAHQLEVWGRGVQLGGGRGQGQLNLEVGEIIDRQMDNGRKFKSSDGVDIDLRISNNADGAGRADVGHGAEVGDLVNVAHQLEVGG